MLLSFILALEPIYDKNIGFFLIILIIPVLLFLFKKFNKNILPLSYLFLILFFTGSLHLLDIISSSLLLNINEIFVYLLFILNILKYKSKIRIIGIKLIILFFVICIISAIFNNKSIFTLILFARRVLIVFVFIWLIANYKFTVSSIRIIIRFILFLLLIQIIAAAIKFMIIGRDELYIGTFLPRGGSHTTLFTLTACAIYWSVFLYRKKPKYILYILGFVFFGIVGRKRAILFLIPTLFLYLQFMFKNKKNIHFVKTNLLLIFLIPSLFVVIVLSSPELTAGSEEEVGSFELEYVIDYTEKYNNRERITNIVGSGRFDALYEVPIFLYEKGGMFQLFFGLGPGDLMGSILLKNEGDIIGEEDLAMYKYNLGYGTRTGFMWFFLQTGLFGVIIWLFIFIITFRKIKIINNKYYLLLNNNQKIILHFVIGFSFIFFIDVLIYSKTPLVFSADFILLWFFVGLIFNPIFAKIDDDKKLFL